MIPEGASPVLPKASWRFLGLRGASWVLPVASSGASDGPPKDFLWHRKASWVLPGASDGYQVLRSLPPSHPGLVTDLSGPRHIPKKGPAIATTAIASICSLGPLSCDTEALAGRTNA